MKKILLILIFFFLFTVCSSKLVYAAPGTFTWRVTDQNGTPLAGAVVYVNFRISTGEWGYAGSCNTNSSGRCSVSISCAEPCELRGDVEYQGYSGSYSGTYNDGAVIGVVINIPAPSPPPGPTPSPGPSPTPSPPPTPPPPQPPGYTCGPSAEERVSRPDECVLCNETGLFCPSCATSFTVNDAISYQHLQADEWRNSTPWIVDDWGGIVIVDPSETTIPFVGKKGNEDEKLYLADYFEGTHEYYRDYPIRVGHGVNPIFMTNYQGVLRKLTPYEYQNQLKKEMVRRESSKQPGEEGAIHDYQLEYLGRLCWDAPLWLDILGAIADRLDFLPFEVWRLLSYCLYEVNLADTGIISAVDRLLDSLERDFNVRIPHWRETEVPGLLERDYYLSDLVGHFPPEPDEEDYIEKWNTWKESGGGRWWKLWQVTPMLSREDTPGYIFPYLDAHSGDTFTIQNPGARIEKVPHVARLYEASQEVKNILMPVGGSGGTSQKKTEPIIASAKEKVLGEKTLLAQIPRDCKFLYANPDCGCCAPGGLDCNGRHTEYPMPNKMGPLCGWEDCADGTPDFCDIYIDGTDGTGPGGVAACNQPYIADTNPNDDLCCTPIHIALSAHEEFINNYYEECEWECECPVDEICDPVTGECFCPVPLVCQIVNDCEKWETERFSRGIGINLLHPYLTEIWEQTGLAETNGLFNFFRPAKVEEFTEIDAADEVRYDYIDTTNPTGGYVSPTTGRFYFNYLGGVQLAKEWLIDALTPYVE